MAGQPLFILLCSGEHEKLQMAAMIASVAAVSERRVQLLVSMNAIFAFDREAAPGQRYSGGAFSTLLVEKGAPDAIGLLRQGRALDVSGWDEERLVGDLFDGCLGLIKIGAKLVLHARSITFQLAEVAASRRLWEEMLAAIAGLRPLVHPP